MRVLLMSSCVLLWLGVACNPTPRCLEGLYFDSASITCKPCPKGATVSDGTCRCGKDYEFVNNRCSLKDGAVPLVDDAGADTDAAMSVSCSDYCVFVKTCFADNALAAATSQDILMSLNAADPAACTGSCMRDTGGDGSADPVVLCIAAGREAAACADDDTPVGLSSALELIRSCCASRKTAALCKSICKAFLPNPIVGPMSDFCE
jgi:hypothetical protein